MARTARCFFRAQSRSCVYQRWRAPPGRQYLNEGFRRLSAVQSGFANDPAVLTSLGAVLQRKGVPGEAAQLFFRASELEPRDARHRLNLAIALAEAGQVDR